MYPCNIIPNTQKNYYSNDYDYTCTIYKHDASGNTMAVYDMDLTNASGSNLRENYYLSELNIYGSSRLGMKKENVLIAERTFEGSAPSGGWYNDNSTSSDVTDYLVPNYETDGTGGFYTDMRGDRLFEGKNHLGNVLVVFSDRKIPEEDNGQIAYYTADVVSYNDFWPYGWVLDGRHGGESYRFSFQEQEGDDEIKGENNSINYKYRMHDTRIGRFFAVDPLAPKYPHNSPYAFSENMVIHAIELEGLEALVTIVTMNEDGSAHFVVQMDWTVENNAGVELQNRVVVNNEEIDVFQGIMGLPFLDNLIIDIRWVQSKLQVEWYNPIEQKVEIEESHSGRRDVGVDPETRKGIQQLNDFIPIKGIIDTDADGTIKFNIPFDVSILSASSKPTTVNLSVPSIADVGSGVLNVTLDDFTIPNTTQINVTTPTGTNNFQLVGSGGSGPVSTSIPIPSGSNITINTPFNSGVFDTYDSSGNLQFTVTPL